MLTPFYQSPNWLNPDPLGRKHSVINEFLMVSIRNLPMKSVGSLSNGQSGLKAKTFERLDFLCVLCVLCGLN